jgi:hypothetical protein
MSDSRPNGLVPTILTILSALIGALLLGGITWLIVLEMTLGLPVDTRFVTRLPAAILAAFCGLLVGAAVARRAATNRTHLSLFAGLATALGAGTAGAGVAVLITAAYLGTYGQPPPDALGRVLFFVAFPAFAVLGWFCGALLGLVAGLGGGLMLRLVVRD